MTRLIDKDELMEWVNNWLKMDHYYHSDTRNDIPISELEDIINRMPTVDAVPVRHGKWMHLGGDEWCGSACGEIECTEGSWEHPLKDRGWKYCRTCGAKMEESKECQLVK